MRKASILFSIILGVSVALDEDAWNNFKEFHNKKYNDSEDKLRFRIFQDSLKEIEIHNEKYKRGESSYFLKTTPFADWTNEEFRSLLNKEHLVKPTTSHTRRFTPNPVSDIPESVDWRTENAVTDVKDQWECACGWAFSVAGTIEGQLVIKRSQPLLSLSAQELLSCTETNYGCFEGNNHNALMYVRERGISSDAQYPYYAKDLDCRNITNKAVGPIYQYGTVEESEESLALAVAQIGPIASYIYADPNIGWKLYAGGIYDNEECRDFNNHGILTVGYGTEDKDFWILKNSWGTNWGDHGYIKLVRGKNQCGIHLDNSYAILDE